MKKFFLLFSLLISLWFYAQQDYSWLKINRFKTAVLNDSIKENSGLAFFNNRLFTINDSGNSSEIFEINKTSGLIKNVFKTNLKNKDWEAIASDFSHLYIGDFGNNAGTRKDLVIYKIPFDSAVRALSSNSAQEFPFYYPEQKDFKRNNLNTNFDTEAMIYFHEKIHVFTKEWISNSTSHYTIDPTISEKQPAKLIEIFQTGYVVTDAAYYEKKLYLIGYTKNTEIFLSIFTETEPGIFFREKPQKYYLGSSLSLGQIEGIAVDEEGIYISGEEFNIAIFKVQPTLYFIPTEIVK
jgi:hypothetical protein